MKHGMYTEFWREYLLKDTTLETGVQEMDCEDGSGCLQDRVQLWVQSFGSYYQKVKEIQSPTDIPT